MRRRTCTKEELEQLPAGSVVVTTEPYSTTKCQNSNYTEIEAYTACQKSDDKMWYPIASLSVWLSDYYMSRCVPFLVHNPEDDQTLAACRCSWKELWPATVMSPRRFVDEPDPTCPLHADRYRELGIFDPE